MTYGKIKEDLFLHKDVDDDDENRAYLPVALNHAMDKVVTAFPLEGKYIVPARYLENVLSTPAGGEDIVAVNGETSFSGAGKAWYFEASGNGNYQITDEAGAREFPIETKEFAPFRGFCQGHTTIRFFGPYLFYLQNQAIYSAIVSDKVEDIPAFASSVPYDFKALTAETLEDGSVFVGFDGFLEEKFEEKSRREGGFGKLLDYEILPNKQGHVIRLNGHSLSEKTIYYRRNLKRFWTKRPRKHRWKYPVGLTMCCWICWCIA